MSEQAEYSPNVFVKPPRVPDRVLGTPLRDPNGRIVGPQWLSPWGSGGYAGGWIPTQGFDVRDMRDPTQVGKEYLRQRGEEQLCDGSIHCKAQRHIHGCFMDYGICDHPEEHKHA